MRRSSQRRSVIDVVAVMVRDTGEPTERVRHIPAGSRDGAASVVVPVVRSNTGPVWLFTSDRDRRRADVR